MESISPKNVPAGAQLIDVRENDEWAAGHARGAIHIPLGELSDRLKEIDPGKDIYLICHSGGRSAQAGQYLEAALGWDVINVEGGTQAWRADGLAIDVD